MAIKKMSGGKKPVASAKKSNPKAAPKNKGSLPKSKTMNSRGSSLAKQVGDQNQLESGRIKSSYGYNPKISALDVSRGLKQAAKDKQVGTDMGLSSTMDLRLQQRAGGKKNPSKEEKYAFKAVRKGPGNTRSTVKKKK
jgi:hypothetical protein